MSPRTRLALTTQALRVLLSVALMALLLPMAGPGPAKATMMAAPHGGAAMTMETPCKRCDGMACRIHCLGWVQSPAVLRPLLPARPLLGQVAEAAPRRLSGLLPAPRGRPPKASSFSAEPSFPG